MIDINTEQRRASFPFSSVWVSASAGSGKTKVLTDRVLNLLLFNGRPDKLLCLTFTKAAAAEMANRVNRILKKWAICSDSDLVADIENLIGETPEQATITKARRLFAEVLETPGGMKIMTIHSFCQSILKRFPLEAGVPPSFDIIDEMKAKTLLDHALSTVLTSSDCQSDIQVLAEYMTEDGLISLLQELFAHRSQLLSLSDTTGLNTVIQQLKLYFGVNTYQSSDEIIAEHFDLNLWEEIQKQNLKKDGTVLARKKEDDKALLAEEVFQKCQNLKLIRLTKALLHIAYTILNLYQNQKRANGVLDYTDLILSTKELLSHKDASAWVLFKLDGGIDHILVDEAQDTNPDQWQIIKALAEEFFSGLDQHDTIRTIFAVGDKKQSIYSFQGADPSEFERMRLFFEDKVKSSENDFQTIPFNLSFRSTQPILDLVNFVLQNQSAKRGILTQNEQAQHIAFRNQEAGLVEIWPLELHEKRDTNEPWKPPVDRIKYTSARSRLAEKMADKIALMISNHEILESAGRPIEAGDFLILVQRRNAFVNELVRLLKERHIPVAGIDRLNLSTHIAIQDLIAAAKFALLPQDDLNLACLLKSPLCSLSEDDLFQAAYNRGNSSVWDRVQHLFPKTAECLKSVLTMADKMPPYEFFANLLGPMNLRKNFISRLGPEVNEALDEFLNLALSFEQNNTASLQLFVDYFNGEDIEIKRDMESSLNAVRIMTVHASKGLQGKIVFLPQTRYLSRERSSFVWVNHNIPLWIPNQSMASLSVKELIQKMDAQTDEENHRLLYVALTRASDRIYICGYETGAKTQEDNWYDLIKNAIPFSPDSDGIIRIKSTQKKKIDAQQKHTDTPDFHLPDWATQLAPQEPQPIKPLSPSKLALGGDDKTPSPLSVGQVNAMKRGQFIHQLLQYLPSVPREDWATVIKRLNTDQIDIPDQLKTLLTDPKFETLFGTNSMAEVPVIGTIQNQAISGQIDRLVVLPNEIWIVDFKTNTVVPTDSHHIPQSYREQLSTYRGLISQIFPNRIIKTYLLWTENLTLMEVSDE